MMWIFIKEHDRIYDITYDFEIQYGKDLARYKLGRVREELDTANLLFNNERLKAAKVRHASDYDEFYIASKEEAEKQIQTGCKVFWRM